MSTSSKMEKRLRLIFDSGKVRFGKLKNPTVACVDMDAGKHIVTLPP